MTSSQRISRAQDGSREAFDELYAWLLPSVYTFAWSQVNDRSAAEEITSETFMTLVAKLDELPSNDVAVLAWSRVVVRNKSVDWVRRRQLQRRATVAMAQSGTRIDEKDSSNPIQLIETQEQRHLVHQILENLAAEYRQVIELRYLDDLSNEQIAEAIGLSASATNSLLYRARKSFRHEHQRLTNDQDATVPQNVLDSGGHA
ncbi:RNA polymerase sigma factor [Rhodopirellula sallentina]|uniref:ECF subfamily RNA polymerase sigma-24 factor n=1 Tax=Rhodopirellula sallentina SM41 TaxID=1263870 RepID=M5U4D3_9BACT|nr:sigma-70 family RNA polymerase sigma factor [Rhodopirellula sallentina]EMI56134.1 ECF subfamily RNA polymerase sigma-24 factor [Rhodopirellula sallentina SM41]